MDPVLISTLATAAFDWMAYRESRGERIDAGDFQKWIEEQVVPALLNHGTELLAAVIGVKANQNEKFDLILAQLAEIRSAVDPSPVSRTWASLSALDRRVLKVVCEQDGIELAGLSLQTSASTSDVAASARLLHELALVNVVVRTGGYFSARRTDPGRRLLWAASSPEGYATAERSIQEALRTSGTYASLESVAGMVSLPTESVLLILTDLEQQGLLELVRLAQNRVRIQNISERLRRM